MLPASATASRLSRSALCRLSLLAVHLLVPLDAAFAALPPTAQRMREIEAAAQAAASLLADPIEEVRQVAPGRFRVQAGRCGVEITIVPIAPPDNPDTPPAPGPLQFTAVPGPVTCR